MPADPTEAALRNVDRTCPHNGGPAVYCAQCLAERTAEVQREQDEEQRVAILEARITAIESVMAPGSNEAGPPTTTATAAGPKNPRASWYAS